MLILISLPQCMLFSLLRALAQEFYCAISWNEVAYLKLLAQKTAAACSLASPNPYPKITALDYLLIMNPETIIYDALKYKLMLKLAKDQHLNYLKLKPDFLNDLILTNPFELKTKDCSEVHRCSQAAQPLELARILNKCCSD